MTPGNQEECPQCGVVLYGGVLSGLCPKCLLQGLRGSPAASFESFEPPSLEALAKAMRGIFEPIEFIGRGGMGAVYKGRQCSLNRIVALKVMQLRAADRGSIIQGFQRFKREARLLAQLSHRNVVGVYDFGLAGDFLYFTMDFVDGPSLRQMLLKSGPLNPSQAFELFLQLCDGLQHAHQNGVIHRDINPANLLVDKKGVLKIADFGLAKLKGGGAPDEWQTVDSQAMGTFGYMAPEQFKKPQEVDHRADIFAAGVVLYEMLTGETPWMGRFSAPSKKAKVDSSLDEVLLKALEKDVTLRYQDISEFKQAVEAVVFNKKEPLQKTNRSDLERERQRLAKALQGNSGDVHVWEQLKQICDQPNDDGGSVLASRLADLYWRQNRSYAILGNDDKREYFTRKLAHAYVLNGKWQRAISEYRELLQRHPDDDAIKKILADLKEREREELDEAA
jgi:serine/threonine protein kinase